MQCTGNLCCFPRGKQAAIVWRYLLFSLCAMFSCFHTTGCEAYSFTTNGYGIFNKFGCMPYTSMGVRHKQVCTRDDLEGQKNCCSPCPTRGSNPGFLDLNSDSLTTEPCPLSCRNLSACCVLCRYAHEDSKMRLQLVEAGIAALLATLVKSEESELVSCVLRTLSELWEHMNKRYAPDFFWC